MATDLVAGDSGWVDVFVRDLPTATTIRASVDPAGSGPDGDSVTPSSTADGHSVVFLSEANYLVPGDDNGTSDVFVRDLEARNTTLVSAAAAGDGTSASGGGQDISADGRQANADSGTISGSSISADGGCVAFDSRARNLAGSDDGAFEDVFVRAARAPTVDSVTPAAVARGSSAVVAVIGTGFFPGVGVATSVFQPGGVSMRVVERMSETQLRVSVTVDPDAPIGDRDVMVWHPATGPGATFTGYGFCPGCLAVT